MPPSFVHEIAEDGNCAKFTLSQNELSVHGLRLRVGGRTQRHIDAVINCSCNVVDSFDEVATALFGRPYEFDLEGTLNSHRSRLLKYRRGAFISANQARACWRIINSWNLDEFSSVEDFDDCWLNIEDGIESLFESDFTLDQADIFEIQAFFEDYSVEVNFSGACLAFRNSLWDKFIVAVTNTSNNGKLTQ